MIIFHTQAYKYLAQEISSANPSFIMGDITVKQFSDGEQYHKINTTIEGQKVCIIGGTIDDAHTLEIFDIANGLVMLGAKTINLVIPYFGYSTMERAVLHGEVVKAKTRAMLLSAIPSTQSIIKVYLFDLHSEGIPYYFNSDHTVQHVYCKSLIIAACRQLAGHDFILAATDAGRAKWVESLAHDMQVDAAFVYKNRSQDGALNVVGINANVAGKTVVIYDDMIRTGGSLMQAAEQYKAKGAIAIFVITTHGLFNNNALDKIQQQGIIKKVICTNSHANAQNISHPILECISIANLVMECLITH
jgi:ribose-phosphate pyrophosphokinase